MLTIAQVQTADFQIDATAPGENLATRFKKIDQGVWELRLAEPIRRLDPAAISMSIKDRQGNIFRIERTFAVKPTEQ